MQARSKFTYDVFNHVYPQSKTAIFNKRSLLGCRKVDKIELVHTKENLAFQKLRFLFCDPLPIYWKWLVSTCVSFCYSTTFRSLNEWITLVMVKVAVSSRSTPICEHFDGNKQIYQSGQKGQISFKR